MWSIYFLCDAILFASCYLWSATTCIECPYSMYTIAIISNTTQLLCPKKVTVDNSKVYHKSNLLLKVVSKNQNNVWRTHDHFLIDYLFIQLQKSAENLAKTPPDRLAVLGATAMNCPSPAKIVRIFTSSTFTGNIVRIFISSTFTGKIVRIFY